MYQLDAPDTHVIVKPADGLSGTEGGSSPQTVSRGVIIWFIFYSSRLLHCWDVWYLINKMDMNTCAGIH